MWGQVEATFPVVVHGEFFKLIFLPKYSGNQRLCSYFWGKGVTLVTIISSGKKDRNCQKVFSSLRTPRDKRKRKGKNIGSRHSLWREKTFFDNRKWGNDILSVFSFLSSEPQSVVHLGGGRRGKRERCHWCGIHQS